MDFSLKKYSILLSSLISAGYDFQTFQNFLKAPNRKVIILRHDVDLLPENSLRFAKIQHEFGISGTYYFRAVPESWHEGIIMDIAAMGHEIGYHYETMDTASSKVKGKGAKYSHDNLIDLAYNEFLEHLETLRTLVPVNTICMHGSPKSKYDNKEIWKKYDYKSLGLIGEPYYDVNFGKVYYLTDTGRRWDGFKVSVRDKVNTSFKMTFHTTDEIIIAAKKNNLPEQIMMTFHPQRWHDENIKWISELMSQSIKNVIKQYFFVKN